MLMHNTQSPTFVQMKNLRGPTEQRVPLLHSGVAAGSRMVKPVGVGSDGHPGFRQLDFHQSQFRL
jgi:hypothetical protein